MSGFAVRGFIQAASAAALEGGARRPARRRPRAPTAEGIADIEMRPSYSPVVLEGAVRLLEFTIVAAVGVLVHRVYLAGVVPFDLLYATAVIGLAALTVLVFQAAGAYAVSAFRAFFLFGLRIVAAWSLVILIALMVVFFAKIGGNLSRVWLASLYFLGAGALILERLVLSLFVSAMTRAGRLDRRTAIVGGGGAAEAMIKALDAQPETGIRIVGLFDDRAEERSPDVIAG
jgi:FlaA1/EpsC-like NDP-sugar epimerase